MSAESVSSSVMALADLLQTSTALLERAGIPSARADAELLAGFVLGCSRGQVQASILTGMVVDASAAESLLQAVHRRASREPLQHITGTAPFRHLELAVGPGVFVPRPETEIVAQFAIDTLRAAATLEPIAVDLGTGSGAIALAMATEVPHALVFGVEVSAEAFVWTRENFRVVGAANARAIFGPLTDALPELDGTVDVVISNPPYIPTGAVPRDAEVRLFDPEVALYGGPDGLDVMREVSRTALRLLHPGGTLVVEHGEQQAGPVADLLRNDGWHAIAHHRDLSGRDRATTALR